MSDRLGKDGRNLGPFDEDRLLDYAMGLEDDPELEAAATVDEVLRHRLERMRMQMDEIGALVGRAVPRPDDLYGDLGDPRWAALRDQLDEPAADATMKRPFVEPRRRWLRVLAPVAAVIVALVVGVSVLENQTGLLTSQGDGARQEMVAPALSTGDKSEDVRAGGEGAEGYAVVLVARARPAQDGYQRFDVVRTLRGEAPASVRLRVAAQPAESGRLHILYLSAGTGPATDGEVSTDGDGPFPQTSVAGQAQDGASPSPSASASPLAVLFSEEGRDAFAVPLPDGTDPDTLTLP
jgi:hypothetical protein